MHKFLHFVVDFILWHALPLILIVFDVNIYYSSLRLFKSDPVESLLPATH